MDNIRSKNPFQVFTESENKSWCPVPWVACSVATNGHYRLCVQANTDRKSRGLFYDSDNKPMKAGELSMRESRNAPLVNEVRLAMLEGRDHPACTRCAGDERSGTLSRRALDRYNHVTVSKNISFEKCKAKTKPDGSINHEDFPLKDLDLRMGNRCNLKCRMCFPGESSYWYSEWLETISKKFNSGVDQVTLERNSRGNVVSSNDTLDWAKDSKLIPNLFSDTPELQNMAIVGGEPLLIEEHCQALMSFVEQNKASEITLSYNSNLTVLPKKFLDLWKEFKEVKIGYSIDGIGPVNDYIRYPSKWESIVRNIEKLNEAEGRYDVWPAVTVMAYNVLYVPEIIKWQIESNYGYQNREPLTLFMVQHPLRFPSEFSTQILPKSVKDVVAQKFLDFQSHWFESYVLDRVPAAKQTLWRERVKELLSSITDHMYALDASSELPQFFERTEVMDKYREQSFSEALPELYELLKPYQNK